MRNLNYLCEIPYHHLDSIIKSKHSPTKDRLINEKPYLKNKYHEYNKNFGLSTLENIPIVDYCIQKKSDYLHCYDNPTKSLEYLKASIRRNQHYSIASVCQYCGINDASTMDHYLPKAIYPEYSVHSLNLIPCCSDCNLLKNNEWLDVKIKNRKIINLYLDFLPIERYLFAKVIYKYGVPKISIWLENINNIDIGLFNLIESHFDRLHLLDRYKKRFSHVHDELFIAFKGINKTIRRPDLIKELILSDYDLLAKNFGANYYKLIFKEALANCDDFLNQF